jgi:hypothetical protein
MALITMGAQTRDGRNQNASGGKRSHSGRCGELARADYSLPIMTSVDLIMTET